MIPVNIEKDKVEYVVIFANWLLTGATVAIAYYAVQQVRLAKAMFVSTFRPKLIIRGIILIRDDRAWQLKYLVANVGGTAAYITESNLTTVHIELVEDKLPTFPPYTADRDSLGRFIVKPGEYKEQLL